MTNLTQHKAIRGVTCHTCGAWVRPEKLYYRMFFYNGHVEQYKNFCVECALNRAITESKNLLVLYKTSKSLIRKYKSDDRKLCLTCKNKFKQVVGECNLTKVGCKYIPIKEKYANNHKGSKTV